MVARERNDTCRVGGKKGGEHKEDRAQNRAKDPTSAIPDGIAIGRDARDHAVEALIDTRLIAGGRKIEDSSANAVGHVGGDVVDDLKIRPGLRKNGNEQQLDAKSKEAAKTHGSELHHDIDAKKD